jgi:hypothetical protein
LKVKLILIFNKSEFSVIEIFILLNVIEGIHCTDGQTNEPFTLHAHLLTWTGDIPALSKSLNLSDTIHIKLVAFVC